MFRVSAVVLGLGVCVAGSAEAARVAQLFRLHSAEAGSVTVEWELQAVRDAIAGDGALLLREFPLRSDLSVDLRVEAFTVVGPNTRFLSGPDVQLDFDPASVALLRGEVVGRPGSHVFLALGEGPSTGYVDLGPGHRRYRISSHPTDPGRLSVFRAVSSPTLPPGVPLCELHGQPSPRPSAGGSPTVSPIPGLKHIEVAVETDHEFFQLFQDADAATAYLVQLYAEISDIFIRDVDTRLELTFTRVWPEANDPFDSSNPLPEFQDYWETNMGGVQRDVAQLLSGRRNYPFGGQAYLNGLCGSNGYSVIGYALGFFPDPALPSPYHYDIFVAAHELGHNFGTGHTQSYGIDQCPDPTTTPQRGTIMSYCTQTWSGMNANGDLYFHSIIQSNMDDLINSSGCVMRDCNQNDVDDLQDIQRSTSDDVNDNDIPDECEDCNDNSVLDDQDIASATSLDLNSNGIPDECEPDCNGNNIPDDKDIADSTSSDAYGNDIPDECEADCDESGVSDYTEVQLDMPRDVDRDTVLDICQDCDGSGTTDLETLQGSHSMWIASGLVSSRLRQMHSTTGVRTAVSDNLLNALVNSGQDLIATADGRVLVSSGGDHRILEFDADGAYQGDLVPALSGGLISPAGLVLTPDGQTLLVSSSGNDRVLAYDSGDGAPAGVFVAAGSGGLVSPFGLTYGPNGNLFVTSDNNEVLEYDAQDGSFVQVFVDAAANGGLDQPRGLTYKGDGNLLVASFGTNEILEFDGDSGAPLGKWAQVGTASVLTQVSPWGIRVGPNGNVFVARTGEDHGSGVAAHDQDPDQLHISNAQIYEFDARNGNFVRTHTGGNDHGVVFPTGFDFVPGWGLDCNFNLIPDDCDVALGNSPDSDGNGVPDECEVDCNGNGELDRLDVIPFGAELDCNANLSPDECDLASGVSRDCNATGVPDECEQVSCGSCAASEDCDDGLSCTDETCNTTAGQCQAVVNPGSCLIESICYGDADPNPAEACEACDPASPFGWSPAFLPEVGGLSLAHGAVTQLLWPDLGPGFVYDVAGDLISILHSSGGVESAVCLADDVSFNTWDDTRPEPAAGDAYYYLVRSQSACGSGSYGSASSGVERQPSIGCP